MSNKERKKMLKQKKQIDEKTMQAWRVTLKGLTFLKSWFNILSGYFGKCKIAKPQSNPFFVSFDELRAANQKVSTKSRKKKFRNIDATHFGFWFNLIYF